TPPALALTSLFGANKPALSQYDQSQLRVITATGDVIPAREVNYQTILHKDWLYPWRQTADYLKSTDLLFINLESPLIKNCPVIRASMFAFFGSKGVAARIDRAEMRREIARVRRKADGVVVAFRWGKEYEP